MKIRIGTRKSALALAQAEDVRLRIVRISGFDPADVALVPLSSRGDDASGPIAAIGTKGAFTESLERALAERAIDLAVHSLKDIPVERRPGLAIGAILEREDPSDVHVSRTGATLATLPPGESVGTGSPRRRAHLLALRPDLLPVEIRGNVDTRLEKVAAGRPPSIILAAAGLNRLRLSPALERMPLETWLPAPGQGAVAVQIREGDPAAETVIRRLDHAPTRRAVEAERAALRGLGGGCLLPFGAFASEEGRDRLRLRAVLYASAADGRCARVDLSGPAADAEALGLAAAESLLRGAPWASRA